MGAEQQQAQANIGNGYHANHDLLIRVEGDVRHLQSDVAEVKADIKSIRNGNAAILVAIVAGFIINYFIGR